MDRVTASDLPKWLSLAFGAPRWQRRLCRPRSQRCRASRGLGCRFEALLQSSGSSSPFWQRLTASSSCRRSCCPTAASRGPGSTRRIWRAASMRAFRVWQMAHREDPSHFRPVPRGQLCSSRAHRSPSCSELTARRPATWSILGTACWAAAASTPCSGAPASSHYPSAPLVAASAG